MNKTVIKVIFGILVITWMITVFTLSNEPADTSSNTSGNTIRAIINLFPNIRNMSENEKEQIVSDLQPIARKLAHFSLYTVGGILIYNFINTFNLKSNKKFIFSFLIGGVYAISDEFHQLFVPGRSGELRDVCIDSSGVLLGIFIMILLIKLYEKNCRKKQKSIDNCK